MFPVIPDQCSDNILWRFCPCKEIFFADIQNSGYFLDSILFGRSESRLILGNAICCIGFRRILGYMPQQQGLYDSYTGRRFLAYMAALKEIPRKAVAAEVDRVAAAVNLTVELDKRLSAYSGGMKQRLLLASALLGDPKLLILDEPTAGLDPRERVRLRTLLADMAQDRIILVATHVVSDVESVASKVILLRAGKIVDAAPVPDLIAVHAPSGGLEDVYLNVFGEGDGK